MSEIKFIAVMVGLVALALLLFAGIIVFAALALQNSSVDVAAAFGFGGSVVAAFVALARVLQQLARATGKK